MQSQTVVDPEDIWDLELAELEQMLAEEEELIKLAEEVKKTDPAVMQKQKPLLPTPYQPKPPPRQRRTRRMREILREFEPAPRWWSRNQQGSLNNLEDLYGEVVREGEETKGRRFIKWTIIKGLDKDLTPNFMEKIRRNVRTSFYMRYIYSIVLRNIEDGSTMNFYKNIGSPWMKNLEDAERWLGGKEETRRDPDNLERQNTKWGFDSFFNVELKVVLDGNAPLLGTGRLPDWLRNLAHNRSMVTLDTYEDNFCLWRCIAVHQGARADRCERAPKELAKRHFNFSQPLSDVPKTPLCGLDRVERNLNKGRPFANWLGIRVYEPQQAIDGEVIWLLRRSPPEKLKNIMTIGVYKEHAFLIKDITKLAKTYECKDCHQRFTRSDSLKDHTKTCSKGKTAIWCPGEKVEKPQTVYERAFFPKHYASKASLLWLEREGQTLGRHIHHAMCGHGGERWINGAPVDGYHPGSKTIYQYHGCPWHGCRTCFPKERERIIGKGGKTLEERFQGTKKRTAELRKEGYLVIEAWECVVGEIRGIDEPKEETKSYPHAVFYDFEAYGDDTKRERVTPMLTIENEHVPISVSIGDTLEREPTHICERDPAELVRRFVEELERRGKTIRDQVREEFVPQDLQLLPKKQREQINEWCNQVPVLGFNSGRYDLNVIKRYFVDEMAETTNKITVAKKGNKTMFMHTQDFRFLDIINYVGPGTSYEKWVKAYGSEGEKSWFPYDWFRHPRET